LARGAQEREFANKRKKSLQFIRQANNWGIETILNALDKEIFPDGAWLLKENGNLHCVENIKEFDLILFLDRN
jgi:hypothetical protein